MIVRFTLACVPGFWWCTALTAAMLLGCQSPGATSPPVAAKTVPAELLTHVPERYRPILQGMELTPGMLEGMQESLERDFLVEESRGQIFRTIAAVALRQRPALIDSFMKGLESEPDADLRQALIDILAVEWRQNRSGKLHEVIARSAVADVDVEVSLTALRQLSYAARRDHLRLLEQRLRLASAENDTSGSRLLRDEIDRYANLGTTLPRFAYRPPQTFAVLPAASQRIRVLAFGDFGVGGTAQSSTAQAMREYHSRMPFDFGITLGDNFYPAGLSAPDDPRWHIEWEEPYGPMGIRFYATLGNHDYYGADSPAAQIAYTGRSETWSMPSPYYTFTAGAAQFFAIDTERLTDSQLEWLDRELLASTAVWKIVYGHRPLYSATRADDPDLIARLQPALRRNKVSLYLAGHVHGMQELQPRDGVHFFIAGSGGTNLDRLPPDSHARSLFATREHGFAVVEATPQMLEISVVGLAGGVLHRRTVTNPSASH